MGFLQFMAVSHHWLLTGGRGCRNHTLHKHSILVCFHVMVGEKLMIAQGKWNGEIAAFQLSEEHTERRGRERPGILLLRLVIAFLTESQQAKQSINRCVLPQPPFLETPTPISQFNSLFNVLLLRLHHLLRTNTLMHRETYEQTDTHRQIGNDIPDVEACGFMRPQGTHFAV
jgi:hypothetical protein